MALSWRLHLFARLHSGDGLLLIAAREARKLGGKATRRLSKEQEQKALEVIAEEWSSHRSKTAACTLAAARLYKEHGIRVSKDTLIRIVNNQLTQAAPSTGVFTVADLLQLFL